jgi:hypothetical protein
MVDSLNNKLTLAAYLTIAVHLVLVIVHAAAHGTLNVEPTTTQLSFILVVIMIAPVVAGFLLSRYGAVGISLFALSMAGSFVFGAYNHFVGHSIDDVSEVAQLQPHIWSAIFRWSAIGLAISEAVGIVVGIWLLIYRQPKPQTHAA